MKLFLDTNIVIDFICSRQPFSKEAVALFQLAADKEVELYVSDLTVINIVYILQRLKYKLDDIYDALSDIRPLMNITSIGGDVIDCCLFERRDDFEDNAQYYSAKNAGVDYIITRNTKDFPFEGIAILTPADFFKIMNFTL